MKWFKHDTDCDRSEGLACLLAGLGWEGYGKWFRLLEIVASKMDETDRCSISYPLWWYCDQFKTSPRKTWDFLKTCEKLLKISVETSQELERNLNETQSKLQQNSSLFRKELIKIEIPNLLKKRDNHTKNLQVACKKLAPRYKSKDKDKDKDMSNPENGITYQAIVDLYHEILHELPSVVKLTTKRQSYLKARLNSNITSKGGRHVKTLEFWKAYFTRVRDSDFLMGDNERGWQTSFDFLITEKAFMKIIESHSDYFKRR